MSEEIVYYDYSIIRSYNRVLNFIIGARGCGKTFGFKKWAVEDFLATGRQFIYMRRNDTELMDKKARDLFWPTALVEMFPGHKFKYYQGAYYIDEQIAGYPMALSLAGQQKSIEYDRVNKVCFDEFIIDSGRYLKDETTSFKEAMVTIARTRFVQFFLISNAITWNNPYFVKFSIDPPESGAEIRKAKSYVLHMPTMSSYVEFAKKSPIGKALEDLDPQYFNYAYKNEVYRDTADFIHERPPKAQFLFTLIYDKIPVGVWISYDDNRLYCSNKYDSGNPRRYAVKSDDHTESTMLLLRNNGNIKFLKQWFEKGLVYFDDMRIKNIVYDFMKKFM